jgi:hypothetical protein
VTESGPAGAKGLASGTAVQSIGTEILPGDFSSAKWYRQSESGSGDSVRGYQAGRRGYARADERNHITLPRSVLPTRAIYVRRD